MAINFPGSLDNFTNPTSASPINSPSHADQHANANDAIEALEAKVGVDGSSVVTSHDYKIAQLQSLVTSAVAGAKSIYQDVRNQSGSAFTKATPVYVSGSTGTSGQLLVSAASNATEATSSKTMGITTSAISNNSNGQVISEGILEGIDTTGAADGDPVWLGVDGAKIYGLANKPSAPAHLVFLGIVIRGGQANTGSMYVKIQNGFELQEIHNVEISSLINGNILAYDSTTQTWKNTNTLQSTASTIPLVVKASASQSVDIFQIQNGSGNAIFWVNQYGQLVGNQPFYSYNRVFIQPNNTSTQGLIVRGLTSQTANLQEWQDSTGTLLSYITASGALRVNSAFGGTQAAITAGSAATVGLIVRGATSQTANLQEWQGSTGTVSAKVASNGAISSISGGFFGTASGPIDGGNYLAVRPWAANHIPFTVKGYSEQTADLTRWVDNAGTVLAAVSSGGSIYGTGVYASYLMQVTAGATTQVPMTVKGAASQTANLQEWQNSAGVVVANVGVSSASFMGTSGSSIYNVGINAPANSNTMLLVGSTGWVNFNSSSQTTGIQTRHVNLGTGDMMGIYSQPVTGNSHSSVWSIAAAIRSAGGASAVTTQAYNFYAYSPTMSTGTITNLYGLFINTQKATNVTNAYGIYQAGVDDLNIINGRTTINSGSTTYVPLTVKGAASQTANLQEWQNSAGTIIASVSSGGNIQAGTYNGVVIGLNFPGIVLDTSAADNTQVWLRNLSSSTKSGRFVGIKARPFYADAVSGDDLVTLAGQQYISNAAYESGKIVISNDDSTPSITSSPARITFHTTAIDSTTLTERMRISNTGLVGINMTSTDAYLSVTGSSSKDAIRVYSQGGNLAFWGGGINNNLYTNGNMYMTGGSWAGATKLAVDTGGASSNGIVVRGVIGQTAHLQVWQDYGPTTKASIDTYGNAGFGGTAANSAQGLLVKTNSNPAVKGIVVIGASSQTADLQQWQNSAGTVLTSIFPSGNISIGTTQAGVHGQANSQGVVTTETAPLIVRGSAPGQNMIELWAYGKDAYITGAVGNGTSVTYTTSIAHGFTTSDYVIVNGIIGNPGSGTLNVGGGATVSAVTTYTFTLPNTTTQTYISGGYARNAQYPGNILQAYRSDGMSLFTIGSSGGFAMADVMSVANVGYQQAGISVQPNLTSSAAIRMYGRSAQTAEILDVRNYIYKSGGSDSIFAIVPDYSVSANADGYGAWVRMKNAATPTTNPTSAGYLYVGSGALNYMGTSNVPQQIVGADGSVKFTSPAASIVPLIIQHASSPSSNYFEIRNSAGNAIWGINSAGEALTRTTTKYGANIQNDSNNNNTALSLSAPSTSGSGIALNVYSGSTTRDMARFDNSGVVKLRITSDGSFKGGNSSTISANTATTVDTVALSSFTTIEYTISIKQGSKIRSSKVLVHTDGTSVDSTEYGIMEMGGGITGILVLASVSSTDSILQITIADATTTNATVKLIKTML